MINQYELETLLNCVSYLIENEQNNYEECLQDGDEDVINRHIYLSALDAHAIINRELEGKLWLHEKN